MKDKIKVSRTTMAGAAMIILDTRDGVYYYDDEPFIRNFERVIKEHAKFEDVRRIVADDAGVDIINVELI